MEWQLIVVLAVVIPIICIPAAFVWYLNIGGVVQAVREIRARKAALGKEQVVTVKEQ
jgi:hypothetical protein